jgi:hypothetical protein
MQQKKIEFRGCQRVMSDIRYTMTMYAHEMKTKEEMCSIEIV